MWIVWDREITTKRNTNPRALPRIITKNRRELKMHKNSLESIFLFSKYTKREEIIRSDV